MDYLRALREDNHKIIDEIKKTANEKGYISNFKPLSYKIKEDKKRDLFCQKEKETTKLESYQELV